VAKEKPAVVVISAELDDDKRKGFEVAREPAPCTVKRAS
jgi:hypothetical protein